MSPAMPPAYFGVLHEAPASTSRWTITYRSEIEPKGVLSFTLEGSKDVIDDIVGQLKASPTAKDVHLSEVKY